MSWSEFLVLFVIFGIPALMVIWFISALIYFRKKNKQQENKNDKTTRIMMIIPSILAGAFMAGFTVIMIGVLTSFSHM